MGITSWMQLYWQLQCGHTKIQECSFQCANEYMNSSSSLPSSPSRLPRILDNAVGLFPVVPCLAFLKVIMTQLCIHDGFLNKIHTLRMRRAEMWCAFYTWEPGFHLKNRWGKPRRNELPFLSTLNQNSGIDFCEIFHNSILYFSAFNYLVYLYKSGIRVLLET